MEVRLPGTVAISVVPILRCTPRWEDWEAPSPYTFRAQDLPPLKQENHLCLEHVWTEQLLFAGMTVVVKHLLFNSHNSPESFHHHHEF